MLTMRHAVVLGTGGHCRVVLSIINQLALHDVLAVVELGNFRPAELIMGKSVKPNPDYLNSLSGRNDVDVFLAIGNNDIRKDWWGKVKSLDFLM